MPYTIPMGSYTLPICFNNPDQMIELTNAMDLWRRMHLSGVESEANKQVQLAVNRLITGQESPCSDTGSNTCWSVDATSRAIRFYPNDPFSPEDERQVAGQWERWEHEINKPPDWIKNLLTLVENNTEFDRNIGYFPNDCFVVSPDETGDALADFFGTINNIRSLDFPYIELEVQGVGELELHLLKVPFGGSAVIVWDMEFDVWSYLWDLVNGGSLPSGNIIQTELEREILQIPPETDAENVIELDFQEDTTHIVRVYFVPRIDYTALDFRGVGGGIREVSACGNLSLVSDDGTIITKQNSRIAEFTRRNFIMTTQQELCEAIICASEKLAQRILLTSDVTNIENSISIDKDTLSVSIDKPILNNDQLLSVGNRDIVNGVAYQTANGINDIITQIRSWVNDDGLLQADIEPRLENLYGFSNVDAVSNIITNAGNPFSLNIALLTEYLYDEANDPIAIAQYAYNEATQAVQESLLAFQGMATQLTYNGFERKGTLSPRDEWRGYSSTRADTFEYTLSLNGENMPERTNTVLMKYSSSTRIIRVEVSGSMTSDLGDTWDGFYREDSNGDFDVQRVGILTFDFTTRDYDMMASNPQYSQSGGYAYNMITNYAGNASQAIDYPQTLVDNGLWTGSVTFKVYDLGET